MTRCSERLGGNIITCMFRSANYATGTWRATCSGYPIGFYLAGVPEALDYAEGPPECFVVTSGGV